MEQKKLLKTIETISAGDYAGEDEILSHVLNELVENEQINIDGGRVWKLNKRKRAYEILFQQGKLQSVDKNFKLVLKTYDVLDKISNERTVLADETNEELKKKGILKFSASGVGKKIIVGGKKYYEYLLALSSDTIDEYLRYTINIVAAVLTNKIREARFRNSSNTILQDVDEAKQLQRSILPDHEYSFHDYKIFGITIPAKILGGDFFDYLSVGEDPERIGIAVGDAASKGISAAAEAMYISGALRMANTFEIKISSMMKRMNQLINKIFSDDRFASMFFCELPKDKNGLCLFSNAGHNPPILISAKTRQAQFLNTTGPLLGPAPNSNYTTDSINFAPGDIMIIFSDGVTEAANGKFQFYEEKRLIRIVRRNLDKNPKEIAYAILDDVMKFSTSDSKYQDDKTIVVIKRKKHELS